MKKFFSAFYQNKLLNTLFLSNVFFSFHYYLTYYINSTFLSTHFSSVQLSALYIIGSFMSILTLLNGSKILNKIGIYRFTVYAIVLECLSTIGFIYTESSLLIGLYFLLHLIVISLIYFNLDVLIETVTTNEDKTGNIRATFLTITGIIVVISPLLISLFLGNYSYSFVYGISSLFLIPMYFCIRKFKSIKDVTLPHIQIKETITSFLQDKNLYNIFSAQFLLQLFYAFMSIYTPLYLQQLGFTWSEIGVMFSIMLLPFVLIEIPVGTLEDKKYGEKEFLTIGFIVLGISTLCISFITTKSFFIWTSILFITRIGAALVEISTDTYFFKKVDQQKTNIIGFFRITRPLSFIVAPLLATLSLQFIPFQYTFIIIGACMIIGTRYSLALEDTK